MYLKFDRHEKAKAMSNASTNKTKLPESGVLSAIKLEFEAVNAATIDDQGKGRIIDHITKVEVTDGGTNVMYSLTGQVARALDFYHLKEVMPERCNIYDGKTQRTTVVIPFGEYVGDPKKGLDLGVWDEVNLEVTNDATTTLWADLALKADIQLITMQELPAPPASYYKHYQWRSEKPSADGQYVRHQLPVNDKIRRYIIQADPDMAAAGSIAQDPIGDSYLLDFSFNERTKYVMKDARPKDILRLNALQYGRVQAQTLVKQSTTVYYDLAMAYVENIAAVNRSDGTLTTSLIGLQDSNDRAQVSRTIDVGGERIDISAIGLGYYHTFVPFDSMSGDEMTFLNPAKTAGGMGAVYADWYGYKDDHTFRSILTVPKKQGET